MKPIENRPKPALAFGRELSRAFVIIIAAPPVLLLLVAVVLLFKSCDLLGVSLFPDYLPAVEARIKLTDAAPEFNALDYTRDDYSISPRLLRNGAGEEYLFVFLEPRMPGVQPVMVAYSAELQHAATYRAADFGGVAPAPDFFSVDYAGRFALGIGSLGATVYAISDVRRKTVAPIALFAGNSVWHRAAYSVGASSYVSTPGFDDNGGASFFLYRDRFTDWSLAPVPVLGWIFGGPANYWVNRVLYNPSRPGLEVAFLLKGDNTCLYAMYLPHAQIDANTLAVPLAANYPFMFLTNAGNIDRSRISLTVDGVVWYESINQREILMKPDGSRLSRGSDFRDVKFVYYEPSGAYGFYVMQRTPELFKVRSWWR